MKKIGKLFLCIVPFLCALFIQVVLSVLTVAVLGLIQGLRLVEEGETDPDTIKNVIIQSLNADVILAVSVFTAVICIAVFGLWYKRSRIDKGIPGIKGIFTVKSILYMLLLGAGLQVGISVLLNAIAMIKPDWFNAYSEIMEQLGMGKSILSIVYIVLIAPVSEELIFRGVILEKSKKIMPFAAANILQALLFGIYHMNLVQGIYAFVIGMFLGMVCIKFKSLYASILLHMIINLSGIFLELILTEEILNTPVIMVFIALLSLGAIVFSLIKLLKNGISENKINFKLGD